MKKISSEVVQKFNQLHKEFRQSYNEESAKKLLNFFQDSETFFIASRCARNNPHPRVHQNFERDWEAVQISLKNWIARKVDLSVPLKFLKDIKIWISSAVKFLDDNSEK